MSEQEQWRVISGGIPVFRYGETLWHATFTPNAGVEIWEEEDGEVAGCLWIDDADGFAKMFAELIEKVKQCQNKPS